MSSSQRNLIRDTRKRMATGLISGISSYLTVDLKLARAIFILLIIITLPFGIWLIISILYFLGSAVIPRDDDSEEVKGRGYIIDVRRIIIGLISLIVFSVGAFLVSAPLSYLLFLYGTSIIIYPFSFHLIGILGIVVSVIAMIIGLILIAFSVLFSRRM